MENKELIKKWLNGEEITPAERSVLEQIPEYQKYQKIAEAAARFRKPEFDEQKHLNKLKERMKKSRPGKGRLIHLPAALKIAAVLVLLLASTFFIYYNTPKSYTTGTGEISLVELPDNSDVRLNAESKIKYYPQKWDANRKVSLEGEAFFEVEKGSTFIVNTENGSVQVLGTSFNVSTRAGFFEVTCYEGSVKVTYSNRETILLPKESFRVLENKINESIAVPEESPGWINQESSFRGVPLKLVLAEIERQFGIRIEAESVDREQLFTGSFSHADRLSALQAVTIPLGLEFRIKEDNKVILYEE